MGETALNFESILKNDENRQLVVQERAVSLSEPLSGRSYVVALSLWEQLLASSFNFLQMQCWIKTLQTSDISAVEPQLMNNTSKLGFSFADNGAPVVASDVIDMESWYSDWLKHGPPLAPLAARTDFIHEIERFRKKVILVQLNIKVKDELECPFTWNISSLMEDIHQYPLLNVTRKVCICISRRIPAQEFNRLVFGDLGLSERKDTLVILKEWRGIRGGRIDMVGIPCVLRQPPYHHLKPSTSVLKDAEIFANEHLGGFGKYVSISARFEKVAMKYWKLSLKELRRAVTVGIKESLVKLKNLKKRAGVDRVYLAYDFGLFGSGSFERHSYYNSSDLLVKFQEDVYNGMVTYNEYKKSLMEFKFQNPGYVAMVQMTLSSRGKCLLQVGWGHCIEFVKSHFRAYHNGSHPCFDCAPRSVC